ncbi:MAG: hypothetical protein WC315_00525 [Candidatus Omnitrophota bacterium]|jgi:hypothetical protein
MITIEGKKYKVVESLGYNHDAGTYGKVVLVDGKERIAVGTRGCWKFWEPQLRPGSKVTGA